MEVSYGIGVTNRYALFYDENEDPLDAIKSAEKEQSSAAATKKAAAAQEPKADAKKADLKGGKAASAPAATAAAAAPAKKSGPKETAQPKAVEQNRPPREDGYQPRGGQGRPQSFRGGRGAAVAADGQRIERNNRRNWEDRPPREFSANVEGGAAGAVEGEYRPRGGYRGTGYRGGRGTGERGGYRGTGERGAYRGGRGGKREFDRQSGSDKSGVKPQEKRDGSGAHNWGSVKDEIEGQMESVQQEGAVADGQVVEGEAEVAAAPAEGAATEAVEAKEGEAAAPVPEEPVEYTLDEWKAKHGERKKPEFNIRQAGEGEDNAQWKKTFVLEKKKLAEEEEEEEEEIIDVAAEFPQRVGRQKFLNIDIRFADSRTGGRGRGEGRGGPRGAGMGGRGRGFEGGDSRGFRDAEGGAPRGGYRGGYRGGRGGEGRSAQSAPSTRGTYAQRGPQTPMAPKVDDEKDFPALG